METEKNRETLAVKATSAYRNMSEKEYLHLIASMSSPTPNFEKTLREDYEIGIYGDEFHVRYAAKCEKCGFQHKFNITEKVGRRMIVCKKIYPGSYILWLGV